uniref:DWNN domain-containing protein n=1 Tax=Scophthalmus maximus TaxID=52904 RepID=A0A8D3D7A9_SCOMX
MTHVHYKFSSKLSYDTVVFDGPHVTLRDLKRQIMCRERLRAADCDLQITNAQDKQEYTDDDGPISKGSSVIVRRIPTSGGRSGSSSKTHNHERSASQHHRSLDVVKAWRALSAGGKALTTSQDPLVIVTSDDQSHMLMPGRTRPLNLFSVGEVSASLLLSLLNYTNYTNLCVLFLFTNKVVCMKPSYV